MEPVHFCCSICLREGCLMSDSDSDSDTINGSDSESEYGYQHYTSKVNLRLECNHIYHRDCIISWFIYSQNFYCPLCKRRNKKLKKEDLNIRFDNISIMEDKYYRYKQFMTTYYDCPTCEYECKCELDDLYERDPERRHQRRRRRSSFRLKMCKLCAIYMLIMGMCIAIVLFLVNIHHQNLETMNKNKNDRGIRDDKAWSGANGSEIMFRRF